MVLIKPLNEICMSKHEYAIEVINRQIRLLGERRKWFTNQIKIKVPYGGAKRASMMWEDAKNIIDARTYKASKLRKAISQKKEEYRKDASLCTQEIKSLRNSIKHLNNAT